MADPHVVTALRRKYSELMGEIERHERDVERIRTDLAHVEATIRLFKHEIGDTPATRPCKSSRWGGMGTGVRAALDVLKAADKPMTLHEIALATMERGGIPTDDLQTVKDVAASLRQSLKRRVGNGVVVVEGYPTRWALKVFEMENIV